MTCDHCGCLFNYGRGVAAIRDVNDVALDNDRLNGLAWYHTCTYAEWPSAGYALAWQAELDAAASRKTTFLSNDQLAAWKEKELNKALHVGTYEAAIENMLRRIKDQRDEPGAFYLHRVGLKIDPARINEGFRDENEEPASQLTTMDPDAEGLDAVRYLNTYEAIGSLSLAVVPEAIAWVQTLKLPAPSLAPTHSKPLVQLLDATQEQLDALRSVRADLSSIPPRQLRLIRSLGEPGHSGVVAANTVHSEKVYELRAKVEQALCEEYLKGISPVVANEFVQAMVCPDDMPVRFYADFFAASAVALTDPGAVIALVARQQPRVVALPSRKKRRLIVSRDW
jgi:hypothetical protein